MSTTTQAALLDAARAILPDVIAVRRELHRIPEIGNDLPQTQAVVVRELRALGLERLKARRKLESLGMAVKLARLGPLGQVARRLQGDPATCGIGSLRRLYADHAAALAADGR